MKPGMPNKIYDSLRSHVLVRLSQSGGAALALLEPYLLTCDLTRRVAAVSLRQHPADFVRLNALRACRSQVSPLPHIPKTPTRKW